jgi:hypothetical protein
LAFLDFPTNFYEFTKFCTEIAFLEKEKLKTKQASAKRTGPLGYWATSGTQPNFRPKAETGEGMLAGDFLAAGEVSGQIKVTNVTS